MDHIKIIKDKLCNRLTVNHFHRMVPKYVSGDSFIEDRNQI